MIYEDSVIIAKLAQNPASLGHIIISPKQDIATLDQVPVDIALQAFQCAAVSASLLFDGLGAQGTNILYTEGDHVRINVLARSQNDGIDLFWNPSRADDAKLKPIASKLKDALWYVGKDLPHESTQVLSAKVENVKSSEKENYKIKRLFRGP